MRFRWMMMFLALAAVVVAADQSEKKGPPPLREILGQEEFFEGKVRAEVSLGAGLRGLGRPGEEGKAREGKGKMRPPEGMKRPPEGKRFGGGGPRMGGGGGMPLMLRMKLTNLGTEPVTVDIREFNSPLGNFVVQPERVQLAPGESVDVEPMSSRLARPPIGLDVKVGLRVGTTTEVKTVQLRRAEEGAEGGAADGATSETSAGAKE